MGFDIDLNLKWSRGTSKPKKKLYDQFWQQNMLNWVLLKTVLSAYEVKNNFCLFERPFFFRFRDINVFLLCKMISDDVILCATKNCKILYKQYL